MLALLRPGDHLLASRWLRTDTRHFFEHELPALGVRVSFVDPTGTRSWRRSLTRTTRLVYLESPVDPTTRLVDMRPARTLAKEIGLALVVDATLASPVNFLPVEHGADVVLHSARAFLDGHGDGFTAGVVCGSTAVIDEVRAKMRSWGGAPHPAAMEQLARGLKTLSVRVATQNATAMAVALALALRCRFLYSSILSAIFGTVRSDREMLSNLCLISSGSLETRALTRSSSLL